VSTDQNPNVEDWIDEAERLGRQGSLHEGAALLRTAIDASSNSRATLTLQLKLIDSLLEAGSVKEAEHALSHARTLADEVRDETLERELALAEGRLAEAQGQLTRAHGHFTTVFRSTAEDDPRRIEALLTVIANERLRGELDSAVERCRVLQSENLVGEELAEFLAEHGAVLLARGSYAESEETLQRAVDTFRGIRDEHRAATCQLDLARAMLGRGARRRAQVEIEASMMVFRRSGAGPAGGNLRGLSDAWTLLGEYHEDGGDASRAALAYREAIDLDRRSSDDRGRARGLRSLARTHTLLREFRRAEECLNEAEEALRGIDDDVERGNLLLDWGALELERDDYPRAETHFRKALEIAEEDGDDRRTALAKLHLARAVRENNSPKDAIPLLNDARRVFAERQDTRQLNELLDDLGEVHLDLDEYEAARELFQESLDLDRALGSRRSEVRSRRLLGMTLQQLGRRTEALQLFEGAVEICREIEDNSAHAEVLLEKGICLSEEGKTTEGRDTLRECLVMFTKLDDPRGVARAARALAGVYRRQGDLERAEELIEDAEREVKSTDDRMELALTALERAQLELARGLTRQAHGKIEGALGHFEALGADVKVATCRRIRARIFLAEGRSSDAIADLQAAKATFEAGHDTPELDQLYDDLARAYLAQGRIHEAGASVDESLRLGVTDGWTVGRGESMLIQAEIALRAEDPRRARERIESALEAFTKAGDAVGKSDARLQLGLLFLERARTEDRDASLREAVAHLKAARSLDLANRDLRGLSRACHGLGQVYLLRHEYERAREVLDQAVEYLEQVVADGIELGSIHVTLGRTQAARQRHKEAADALTSALRYFGDDPRAQEWALEARRLLARERHAMGDIVGAFQELHALGEQQVGIWSPLIKTLHPGIVNSSESLFARGAVTEAVHRAFVDIEDDLRLALDPSDQTARPRRRDLFEGWLDSESVPKHPASRPEDVKSLIDFCVTAFQVIRNPLSHERRDLSVVDGAAMLGVAHLIRTLMGIGEHGVRDNTENRADDAPSYTR
jgi:tetratricopeptide (TPR) repeat protein